MNETENTIHKSHSGDYSEFDICFKYYEKAIEGRNFHYQNYNTWVNYYAIFTGALFVGYYSIIGNCKINAIIPCLIVFLGYITSLCWHLTVKGHYHWMLSWIKVAQSYEKKLAKILKKSGPKGWYVYTVYSNPPANIYHKNISSQKLTSIFTLIVCIAWGVLLLFEFVKVGERFISVLRFQNVCIIVGAFLIGVLVPVISRCILDKPSDVSKIKKSISEKQESCNND